MHESSLQDHESGLHEVIGSLQKAGFALMEEKVTFRTREIIYLWHLKISQWVNVLPGLIKAPQAVPHLRI
jgi:hypothetical protein